MGERVMVTGGAGFIGSHLIEQFLKSDVHVLCVDNFDTFYDPLVKRGNLSASIGNPRFALAEVDIRDSPAIAEIVAAWRPTTIVHLAAKAGVRPSLHDPRGYAQTNILGTLNLLEAAKAVDLDKFIFASSSSVYGLNDVPFSESQPLLTVSSPYAATKVAGEALCQSYASAFGIPIVALRFFTVYGPRQRPDLAIHEFAERILAGQDIQIFGDGSSERDYTYVDDIIQGIQSAISYEGPLFAVFNLGNSTPIMLNDLVDRLELALGRQSRRVYVAEQAGDVPRTCADISKASTLLGYSPSTSIDSGLERFVRWLELRKRRE